MPKCKELTLAECKVTFNKVGWFSITKNSTSWGKYPSAATYENKKKIKLIICYNPKSIKSCPTHVEYL